MDADSISETIRDTKILSKVHLLNRVMVKKNIQIQSSRISVTVYERVKYIKTATTLNTNAFSDKVWCNTSRRESTLHFVITRIALVYTHTFSRQQIFSLLAYLYTVNFFLSVTWKLGENCLIVKLCFEKAIYLEPRVSKEVSMICVVIKRYKYLSLN